MAARLSRSGVSIGMRGLLPSAMASTATVTAAYSLTDQQALRVALGGSGSDPVLASPRVASESRFAIERTFRPYRYGASDPRLRPAV